jgi:hypothetical protein
VSNMGTEANSSSPQTPEQSPYDQAVALVEAQFREGSPSDGDAAGKPAPTNESPDAQKAPATTVNAPAAPDGAKPGEPTSPLTEIEEAKRKLSENAASVQRQHSALTRRLADHERDKAQLAAEREEIGKLTSFPAIVQYLARKRGADGQTLWQELIEDLKTGGKRSPENELRDELRQLKTERQTRADTERERQEREAAERTNQEDREALEAFGVQSAEAVKTNADRYPTLAKYPARMVGASAMQIQMEAYAKTRKVYALEEVLAYLEQDAKSQLGNAPEATPLTASAKPKAPKVTTPTNADASPVDPRTLSFEERKELAARQLQAQLNTG